MEARARVIAELRRLVDLMESGRARSDWWAVVYVSDLEQPRAVTFAETYGAAAQIRRELLAADARGDYARGWMLVLPADLFPPSGNLDW